MSIIVPAILASSKQEFREYLNQIKSVAEYIQIDIMDGEFGEEGWVEDNVVELLNDLFKYKPKSFDFNGTDPYGDNTYQTPIWIRPRSLMAVNKKHNKGLKKKYIQIVGHTQVKKLDLVGSQKSAGGRYYLIDCQESTGEYLVIQDGELSVGQTR